MSGPAVVIGYLLLIPSILGMLIGGLGLFATGATASSSAAAIDSEARQRLTEAGIATPVIEKVLSGSHISPSSIDGVSSEQQMVITDTQLSVNAVKLGAGAGSFIAGGLSIIIILVSFIGGLLGWLLVMKKWVLQCNRCSAAVAAS